MSRCWPGPTRIAIAHRRLHTHVPAGCRLDLAVQTNGTLLDEPLLRRLPPARRAGRGQRRRRTRRQRPAPPLPGRPRLVRPTCGPRCACSPAADTDLYAGILCTVDLPTTPSRTYEHLLAFAPPRLDFLLPHGNWAHPPPGRAGTGRRPVRRLAGGRFDRWYDAPRRETEVRLFDSLVALVLGGRGASEAVGPDLPDVVTVQTDGSLAAHDALLTTASGMAETGLTVFANTLDEAAAHPRVRIGSALGATCRACPVVRVCGGGLPAHRYRGGGDFTGPSVYCADLYRLVTHVEARVRADVQRRLSRLRQRRAEGT